MYLVNNFGTLALFSSLLASSLIPGITPPLASAKSDAFSCAIENDDKIETTKCSGRKSICWINVETGAPGGCQPVGSQQCGTEQVPHDGSIYCADGTKHCCCADPNTVCNKSDDPAIKEKICAVPELRASKLCCPQGGCTAGKSPPRPGGSSAAAITFSGFLTGTVATLTLAVL